MHTENPNYSDVVDIFALLIRCPFGDETAGCPYASFRSDYSLEDKFDLADILAVTPAIFQPIQECHRNCYEERMGAIGERKKQRKYLRSVMAPELIQNRPPSIPQTANTPN